MCLMPICMPSSEKYPIRSLAHFFVALFYIVNYMNCLYVLQMNSWCLSSFINIFYPFSGLSFSFFYGVLCCAHAFKVYYVPFVSFWLTFHDSKRCIFFLIAVIDVRACSVYIFLKSFIVSALTFRSLKYLEVFLVCILLESILISFSFSLFQEPSHCPL